MALRKEKETKDKKETNGVYKDSTQRVQSLEKFSGVIMEKFCY